ncbi:hypothetical protein [Chryseobacterium indoltheticum]|uniref:hypothetical protein n=1 Tax=Chryseobacterium indoltheticum TaxID=254 RepID=UPI003F4992AA
MVVSGSYDEYQKFDFYKLLNQKDKNYENKIWLELVPFTMFKQLFGKHSLAAGAEAFF